VTKEERGKEDNFEGAGEAEVFEEEEIF